MTSPSSNTGSQRTQNVCQGAPRHDDARGQRPRLAPPSIGGRLATLAVAALAASVSVGSQLGLVALYSGEVDQALADLKPARAASQVVASALPVARRSPSSGTKFDPVQGDRRPWEHGLGRSEE